MTKRKNFSKTLPGLSLRAAGEAISQLDKRQIANNRINALL